MKFRCLALVALVVACQAPSAEEADPASVPELSVQSQRERLHALKDELVRLEDQFFSEYNKVNDLWYYNVDCTWEFVNLASTHLCRPVFQKWSEREAAIRWYNVATGASYANDVRLRTAGYQKHMVEVVRKNPGL